MSVLSLSLGLLLAAAPEPVPPPGFWKVWADGQAEVSGYRLTQPRYGEVRQAHAVLIYVTETFSRTARVKSDPGKHPKEDEFPVMKLNLVKDFQTGVYDYNLMTSVFVALAPEAGRPAGQPTKVTFSSQEWCGNLFSALRFDKGGIQLDQHSYFDGEGDLQATLTWPEGGLSADALPLWARGFAAPTLAPGESQKVKLLTSLETARLAHVPVEWKEATLSRAARPEPLTVPAGTFQAERLEVRVGDQVRTYWVEAGGARRLLRWTVSGGEEGVYLAGERFKYWEHNKEGGEKWLQRLGLPLPRR